tara:strand:+ start:283 stop:501 length:219 start_codon:yes stop_codon:yes gene_type:complete
MENPLTRDVMIAVDKKDLIVLCETLLLGIDAQTKQWDRSPIGAGMKNCIICHNVSALALLLSQVHNKAMRKD